jgi:hypothetical protein
VLIAYNKKMSTNVRTYKDDEIEMCRTFMTHNLQRCKHRIKTRKKTTLYQDDDQHNVALKQQNNEKIYYTYVKITYLNKMEK